MPNPESSHRQQEIDLLYGRGGLQVTLPQSCEPTILRKHPQLPVADAPGAVQAALDHPIGSAPLGELARGRQSACILICDNTRPVPNHVFLRPMIEELLAAGMAAERICVVIATGLHRPNEGDELRQLVGDDWVLKHVRVENHFARDDAQHVDLGTTTRGTAIKLDRRFVEADLKIATGLVEPHFMAGWSGGRKVIAPGIAHADTIRSLHSSRILGANEARVSNLAGNPLHEEQLEILATIGATYSLNTVLNEARDLVAVTFGAMLDSHEAAVRLAQQGCVLRVGRQFQTVVTSSAGAPLDQNFYQTVKCMVTPLDILAPGGTLIVASECAAGLGSAEFRESQRHLVQLGPQAFLRMIEPKQLAAIDEWETQMQVKALLQAKVQLYSTGLSQAERTLTGVECIDDIASAIAASVRRSGDAAVAIIPEGPYVVPLR